MANKQTQPFYRRPDSARIIAVGSLLTFAAIIALVGGSLRLFNSKAADPCAAATGTNVKICGRVYDSRTNTGIPGAKIANCNNQTFTTDSNGYFSFVLPQFTAYCVRITYTKPAGWNGPVLANQRPEHTANTSYEAQVAGKDCYKVTGCTTVSQSWDLYSDKTFAFVYSSPAPVSISSFTATPSTITLGGASTLSWSSTGTGCTIVYGSTTKSGLANAGSLKLNPTITSQYNLTCIKTGAASASRQVTIIVNKPSSGGSSGGSTTKKPTTGSTGSTNNKVADSQAPSAPTDFQAAYDNTSKSVNLSWTSSTDNVGVANYQLQRSDNSQQNWQDVSTSISGSQTNYGDLSPAFSTTFYYRIRALDAAGNSSDYVTAQVNTGEFSANTTTDQDTTITSEDNLVSVLIPAGALSQPAFCSLSVSTDVLPPNNNGQIAIAGPYELTCRTSDGTTINKFDKPFVLTATINPKEKGVNKLSYFAQGEDESWNELKVTGHDKGSNTDTVDLQNYTVFTVMGTKKSTPLILKIFIFLIIVAIIIFLIRFINTKLLKRKAQTDYDEYLRKAKGL